MPLFPNDLPRILSAVSRLLDDFAFSVEALVWRCLGAVIVSILGYGALMLILRGVLNL
jgi:hypothetical protein